MLISNNDKTGSPCSGDYPATVAKHQRSRSERLEGYLSTLFLIHTKYGFKVRGCGGYGITSSSDHTAPGVRCDCPVCPRCIPIKAKLNADQLWQVVRVIQEGSLQPASFATGSITMSSEHDTLNVRMKLLGDSLAAAKDLAWWRKAVLGYEEIFHYSGSNTIHGHIQVFYVMKPNADLEMFKRSLYAYFQKRIGSDLIKWNHSKAEWLAWLQPAAPEPALFYYLHSDLMKSGNGYTNFCDRKHSDLKQIIPCISSFDQVRRGGIISTTRKELGMTRATRKPSALEVKIDELAQQDSPDITLSQAFNLIEQSEAEYEESLKNLRRVWRKYPPSHLREGAGAAGADRPEDQPNQF